MDGRVDSDGEAARVSRLRFSYGEEYGAGAIGCFCRRGRGVLSLGEWETVSSLEYGWFGGVSGCGES